MNYYNTPFHPFIDSPLILATFWPSKGGEGVSQCATASFGSYIQFWWGLYELLFVHLSSSSSFPVSSSNAHTLLPLPPCLNPLRRKSIAHPSSIKMVIFFFSHHLIDGGGWPQGSIFLLFPLVENNTTQLLPPKFRRSSFQLNWKHAHLCVMPRFFIRIPFIPAILFDSCLIRVPELYN
jgi:hypothetical protein